MESSSENSFAWTDTSSDSFNSSSKDAVEMRLKSSEKTDLNHHHSMKYKEKHSFLESQEKELKIKIKEENNEVNSMSSHKKKRIKIEPDSDNEFYNKKEKVNDSEIIGTKHESQNSMSYDETYLDMKVKQEESSIISSSTKKKKSKKKRQASDDSSDIISTISTELKGTIQNPLDNNSEINHLPETESETGRTKSKKKKKKSKEIYHNGEDEIDIVETTICKQDVCKTQDKHGKVNHCLERENHSFEEESDETGCNEISAIKCDNDMTHTISFIDKSLDKITTGKTSNNSLSEKTLSNHLKQAPNRELHTTSLNVADSSKQRTSRISERILFEDEDDDNVVSSPVNDVDYSSNRNLKKTKQFLKANPNLRLVTEQFYDNSNLTQDDEIWILKCPKEIEIGSFTGKNINIHGKCKIKFDGQTYDGNAEEDIQSNTLTILSMEHNAYKIRNLPLNGIISLRKRIPKAHFHDDNVMVNNQTNFIPLPETKCRHPLFGSNYKKALKIPASIAERLNALDSIVPTMKTEKRKKKKHKLDKNILEQVNQEEQEPIMKIEPDLPMIVSEKKKKKKRKITDDEGPAPKKVKRIKHDPESAEAWESEKAIEENLFNY